MLHLPIDIGDFEQRCWLQLHLLCKSGHLSGQVCTIDIQEHMFHSKNSRLLVEILNQRFLRAGNREYLQHCSLLQVTLYKNDLHFCHYRDDTVELKYFHLNFNWKIRSSYLVVLPLSFEQSQPVGFGGFNGVTESVGFLPSTGSASVQPQCAGITGVGIIGSLVCAIVVGVELI